MTRLTVKQTEKLIEVLQLKHNRKGLYQTAWGKKSFEGLGRTIENIINETENAKELCNCGDFPGFHEYSLHN